MFYITGFLLSLCCVSLFPSSVEGIDFRNQDPLEADPLGAIECIGEVPPWAHFAIPGPPLSPGQSFTLQNLCAQAQYGGSPAPHNLEAVCINRVSSPPRYANGFPGSIQNTPYRVAFGSGLMRMTRWVALYRLLSYCTLRCHCTGVPPAQRAPLSYAIYPNAKLIFDLSRPIDRLNPPGPHDLLPTIGFHPLLNPRSLHIYDLNLNAHGSPWVDSKRTTISTQNLITCPGLWPSATLPSPATPDLYQPTDPSLVDENGRSFGQYSPLTRLCALAMSGGHETLNLGAYCHLSRPSAPGAPRTGEIWFSDEMTPNVDWTFSPPPGNSRTRIAALMARRHCARHCTCKDPDIETLPPSDSNNIWAWLSGDVAEMAPLREGALAALAASNDDTATEEYEPATTSPGREAVETAQPSPSANTTETALPAPETPTPPPSQPRPPASVVSPGPEPARGKKRCAPLSERACRSSRDCAPAPVADPGCVPGRRVCLASGPTRWRGRDQGWDPTATALQRTLMFAKAKCVDLTSFGTMGVVGGRRRVRRGLVEDEDAPTRSGEYHCACNATYVSTACCHDANDDGIIWEDGAQKIGLLAI